MTERSPGGTHPGGPFPTTLWTQIRQCHDASDPQYRSQLETLCNRYWPPVYFYIRRNWNRDPEVAKDLCQSFFLKFLEPGFLLKADMDKGRFRSFVCSCLQNFLRNEHRDAHRQKRRPESGPILSIDQIQQEYESFDLPDPNPDSAPPEATFDRLWKRAIVQHAIARLRELGEQTDRSSQIEVFIRYRLDVGESSRPSRPQLAKDLELTLAQVNYALQWVQQEFIQILEAEVRDQVSSEEDFESEMQLLFCD
ncbi:MAG: hypothetical protein QF752_00685 [Planctomycetota bacterium]|nr:hypothetical protein [Planctomycetota bacterium]